MIIETLTNLFKEDETLLSLLHEPEVVALLTRSPSDVVTARDMASITLMLERTEKVLTKQLETLDEYTKNVVAVQEEIQNEE